MKHLLEQRIDDEIACVQRSLQEAEQLGPATTGEVETLIRVKEHTAELLEKLWAFAQEHGLSPALVGLLTELSVRRARLPASPPLEVIHFARNLLLLNPHLLIVDDIMDEGHEGLRALW